ncbi:MAG TPA: 50S ribosomal protein L5 [Phycisphaerae bacterium]|nr:50S ribosomal protein L5 [Phycisphaerae bacterium]
MAKEEKKEKKAAKTPEQIEAEKAAKVAKKAEMAAKAKEAVAGGAAAAPAEGGEAPKPEGKPAKGGKGGGKKKEEGGEAQAFPKDYVPRLKKRYEAEIAPGLMGELKLKNKMALPRIEKIVISMGLGKAIAEKPRLEAAVKELTAIAGQKAVVCKAKKSVSNFKLREGMEIGAKVTLRGNRMWEFLDRLIVLAIPRVKDFRGLNPKGFDGRGNYNMGIAEQTVFPEVDSAAVTFHQGMNITIVTTAGDNARGFSLLKHLGMPFRQDEAQQKKAG